MIVNALALALSFAAPVDRAPDDVLAAMELTGMGEATRYLARGGIWYSFALDQGDSALIWPAHTTVGVELKDSTRAVAVEAFVMSPPPEQRITRLGGIYVRLEPGSLWRRRFRNHGIRTVIFARFARGFTSDAVVGAWAWKIESAATPAAHSGGSP